MILFPAIDLLGGQCVRLTKGDYNAVTVYNSSPANQAEQFAKAGAAWLHVVDLDGAKSGQPVNIEAVRAIRRSARLKIQLGGGIRTIAAIDAWLSAGIDRVILGTIALRDPQLVRDACRVFPGRIAVGIDSKEGFVAAEGWLEDSHITALELAKLFADSGVSVLIHTDISRDGLKTGLNIQSCIDIAKASHLPVIASGGLANLDDVRAAKAASSKGVLGAIAGRALYDGSLDLKEALAVC